MRVSLAGSVRLEVGGGSREFAAEGDGKDGEEGQDGRDKEEVHGELLS